MCVDKSCLDFIHVKTQLITTFRTVDEYSCALDQNTRLQNSILRHLALSQNCFCFIYSCSSLLPVYCHQNKRLLF